MRKFLLFLICIFWGLQVLASDENFGVRGPLNYIQSKAVEKIISTQVEKIISGKIKTRINSYGTKALRNGIFKTVKIKGENLFIEEISIEHFEAITTTENNRLDISDKSNPKLLTDIEGNYNATITNENLKSVITSPMCKKEITKLNKKLAPFAKINEINIFCQNSRLHFQLDASSNLFGSSFSIKGSTDICSNTRTTELKDLQLNQDSKSILANKLLELLNRLNPINIVIKKLNNAHLNIIVNRINIVDDKIKIFGIIKVYRGV